MAGAIKRCKEQAPTNSLLYTFDSHTGTIGTVHDAFLDILKEQGEDVGPTSWFEMEFQKRHGSDTDGNYISVGDGKESKEQAKK
jgi:hypothetical protein